MYSATRTIYGIDLQLAMMRGIDYTLYPNTTLNEKFAHHTDKVIPPGSYPTIKYLAIGNGGTNVLAGAYSPLKLSQHKPIDGALYSHVPFVIKPVSQDLTPTEQLKYRLRIETTIGGTLYAEYHLKVLDATTDNTPIMKLTKTDIANTLSVFNTNIGEILAPVAEPITLLGNTTSNYIAKTFNIKFSLTLAEMADISAAIELKYGVDASKILTEFGVCTGYDLDVGGGVIESIGTQIGYFMPVNYDLQDLLTSETNILKNLELGGMEPLLI